MPIERQRTATPAATTPQAPRTPLLTSLLTGTRTAAEDAVESVRSFTPADVVAGVRALLAASGEAAARPPAFDPRAVPEARSQLTSFLRQPEDRTQGLAAAFAAQYDNDPLTTPRSIAQERVAAYRQLADPNPPDPDAPKSEEAAREQLAEALRVQRQNALPEQSDKPIKEQVSRMSQADYDALSPTQKAAIDFNGMLVTAVRKDRRMQEEYEPTTEQREIYDDAVESMFGEDRGSDMFAPETLSVLRQIRFEDSNADLDDFLSLQAAIREKDIKHLELPAAPVVEQRGPLAADRLDLSRSLALNTQGMQAAMAQSTQLLDSINKTAAVERNADLTSNLGGLPNDPRQLLGFGQPADASGAQTLDGYFQMAFDALADKGRTDSTQILQLMAQDRSPQEMQAFTAYVEARTRNAERFDLELGADEAKQYRSGEEIRKLLGLREASRGAA